MESTNAIDAAEALRAVRVATAQEKQRKQLFREWERRIGQACAEPPCPPKATASGGG